MATEIERKFLVTSDDWQASVFKKRRYTQGYLASDRQCSIRVRMTDEKAHLNIKSATLGITRSEYDYEIPLDDAKDLLANLCIKPLIEKTRYYVKYKDHTWEIDVFSGENKGLVIAEVELQSTDETFAKPGWLGDEVSDDPRYYNVCLVEHPYQQW